MAERDVPPGPDPAGAGAAGPAAPEAGPARDPSPTGPLLGLLAARSPIRVVRRPSQQTAALRQELAEKAAAADELRVALDELRHVLDLGTDGGAGGSAPRAGRGHRRGRLLVVAAVLAAVGVIALLLLTRGPSAGAPGVRHPAPPSAASSASAPATPATGDPGAGTPGTDVRAVLDGDGAYLDVVEHLVLDAATDAPLVLQAPGMPALGRTGISDLQVRLDDRDAAAVPNGSGTRWTVSPAAGSRYARATLRYRISGGVVAVTPAAPGRALGLVTPLTAATSQAHGHPVVVRVPDRHVVGVSCPGVRGTGSVCGARTAEGWTASVPAGALPVVLLQVNR